MSRKTLYSPVSFEKYDLPQSKWSVGHASFVLIFSRRQGNSDPSKDKRFVGKLNITVNPKFYWLHAGREVEIISINEFGYVTVSCQGGYAKVAAINVIPDFHNCLNSTKVAYQYLANRCHESDCWL